MNTTILILLNLATFIIGIFLAKFMPVYFSKKAENLATKEDISEITDKIETVKSDYAKNLESLKAELSAKLNTHGFRYEYEFDILQQLTSHLVDVREFSVNLRPAIDFIEHGKTEQQIKQERLNRLFAARKELYYFREKKRPFFPNNIYDAIVSIDKTVTNESVSYRRNSAFDNEDFEKYWSEAETNQEKIISDTNAAMELIRKRIIDWDKLQANL